MQFKKILIILVVFCSLEINESRKEALFFREYFFKKKVFEPLFRDLKSCLLFILISFLEHNT